MRAGPWTLALANAHNEETVGPHSPCFSKLTVRFFAIAAARARDMPRFRAAT